MYSFKIHSPTITKYATFASGIMAMNETVSAVKKRANEIAKRDTHR